MSIVIAATCISPLDADVRVQRTLIIGYGINQTSRPDVLGFGLAPTPVTAAQRTRVVLVGDAAHSVHPLAGQGLNLGLADARALAETLSSAAADGADLGSPLALSAYESARWGPNEAMLRATDALHLAYAVAPPSRLTPTQDGQVDDSMTGPSNAAADLAREAFVWIRGTGMEIINELGPLKDGMTRFAGSVGPRR